MTRVLIVDDQEENLYYLRALLSGHGYAVETAKHGAEALFKARRDPPEIIVSDLLMPVMDGFTLLRHWKADARLKQIPFVVYTATYTAAEDERLAISLGADAFIVKPAEPEEFLRRIREVEANQVTAVAVPPKHPVGEEKELLKIYSETLIRKLEEKTLQLEEANRALREDIATRQQTEAQLTESERRLGLARQSAHLGIWDWNVVANRAVWDAQMYALYGLSEPAFRETYESWQHSLYPDDRARAEAELAAALEGKGDYHTEFRVQWPNGDVHNIEAHGLVQRGPDGSPVRMIGVNWDITERRQAQAKIEEQAALLDETQDAIIVRDLEDRILFWNRGAEKVYGWTRAEAVGRSVRALFSPESEESKAGTEVVLREGEWSGTLHHLTRAGVSIAVESRWTLLRHANGTPKSVLAVNTNVTERKRIEAQFIRAQRLEVIGALASGVAHDLNNMLAPIVMGLSFLKQENLPDDILKTIEMIDRSAQRGTNLVKQVLSFARGSEGTRMPVKLAAVAGEFAGMAAKTFPRQIKIQVEMPREIWPVLGDPTQLYQVILNLGVNARDAMPKGGTLLLSARNFTVDQQHAIMNRLVPPGRYVILTVADSGIGMTGEVLGKLFEPFFTTKGAGTGLGLSTTQAIVRNHGGFIDVRSVPNSGTTFDVYLPAEPAGDKESLSPFEAKVLLRGQGEGILVVDDEASILQITRETLESFGYRVLTADDGAHAIGLFALHRTEIAVVLTDMVMPVMDGGGLAAALRRLEPGIQIIATSGLNSAVSPERLQQIGIQHFLPKPYTAETLLTLLRKVLGAPRAAPLSTPPGTGAPSVLLP